MTPPKTEYSFTLPIGFADDEGTHHREGTMRLATARDEIEPLRDARVRENGAYASVLRLARVLTRVGDVRPVTPAHVERLYAADFAHLQRLYERVNSAPAQSDRGDSTPETALPAAMPTPLLSTPLLSTPIMPTPVMPVSTIAAEAAVPLLASTPADGSPHSDSPSTSQTPRRPRALEGMSDAALNWMLGSDSTPSGGVPAQPSTAADALPIGLRQQRERSASREALMRSPGQPRRGRVTEGNGSHVQEGLPSPPLPTTDESEPSREPLMRLSSRRPAHSAPATQSPPLSRTPESAPAPSGGGDFEDVYEEMIVRLRRELLVERERMGAPFEA